MQLAEARRASAQGYPPPAPAAVENPELAVGKTAALRRDAEPEPLTASLAPLLPGYFVAARYESDCARFVSEAKRLARVRAEALVRPTVAC